ncbi:cupin domain-containing protein [Vibrio fluvialis]|uniref:Cupin domain-containing protein n=1 Tax=Vibrio fluvialis TaxID=676 RepID=A0AAX2LVT7_VIBFL|nr:cupin domain-containing protein [Vibrio fluvialis]AMF92611.1 cupin domain-containing protein [Vibrio fluvialis]EKO3454029.1 cupin domain-containing protein [Vibrio fluvialis]EKO3908566.1 cupin domain-containing protein [Vibrio fluvialis]EKO3916499.1 cupin domain-containing protein [Vibrio fluvialis]EKO3989260.1 cupin domain-containing protein [Vibrio fluvialis]
MNLFETIPAELLNEQFTDLLRHHHVRIERILSKGHTSPESGWYDQDEHEWVLVLQGCGTVEFDNGESTTLNVGDYLNIPAHTRHKVCYTSPDQVTLWLAVFYQD